MDDKVVSLYGDPLPGSAQLGLVETLELLLKQARAGELKWIAYTVVDKDERSSLYWVGKCRLASALAGLSWLHFKFFSAYSKVI